MSSTELEEAYGDHLDPMVRDGLVAAYYLAVEKNGSIEVDRGLGAKGAIDVPDPDKNTTFALFSLSKPIVSVAVLKLVDQGLIDLDAPLSRYLDEFQNLKLKNGKTVESQPKIINHFTHTAGFSHNRDFRGKSELSEAYQSKGLFTLKSMVTADTKGNALAIHVNQLAEMPLSSSPGSRFEYSVSTDVLGRLAEVVSGKRLDVFLEEALFGPLGMKDTGFYLKDKNRTNKATLMKPLIRTFPVPGTYQRFEPHPPFLKGGSQNLGQEARRRLGRRDEGPLSFPIETFHFQQAFLARRAVDDDAVGTRAVAQLVARVEARRPNLKPGLVAVRLHGERLRGLAEPRRRRVDRIWHGTMQLAVEQRRAAQERGFIQRSAGEFGRGGVQSRPRQHPRTRRRVVLAERSRVSLFGGAVGVRDKCGVLPDDFQIGDVRDLAARPQNRPAAPAGQQPWTHPDVAQIGQMVRGDRTDGEALHESFKVQGL